MRLSRPVVCSTLPRLIISCFSLVLWIDAAGAADAPTVQAGAPESIEEIEVTGQRLLTLRVEIEGIENRMFDMFNALNDRPEFKIHCIEAIVTGSRIPERECVPVYMKRARMSEAQKFLFFDLVPPNGENSSGPPRNGGAKSMNTRGAPQLTEEQLWFHNNPNHVAFNAKFRELADANPALASMARELQTKKQQLDELEDNRRKQSGLRRFFSSFGKND